MDKKKISGFLFGRDALKKAAGEEEKKEQKPQSGEYLKRKIAEQMAAQAQREAWDEGFVGPVEYPRKEKEKKRERVY